jgi:hypothetical protein
MRLAPVLAIPGILFGASFAAAQPAAPQRSACFFINEFRGWKAPDPRTIFIRVGLSRFYRLDLAANCPVLTMPQSHLITRTRGSDLVCSAIDWDLSVAQPPPVSFPEPCIVKKMTLMSPDEVAAIPPKFRP